MSVEGLALLAASYGARALERLGTTHATAPATREGATVPRVSTSRPSSGGSTATGVTPSPAVPGGSFVAGLPPSMPSIGGLSQSARDRVLEQALLQALPARLQRWVPVRVSRNGVAGTIYVAPDWLGFGDDNHYYRVSLPAPALQRIADRHGAVLPTVRMVEAIERAPGAVVVPMEGLYDWSHDRGLSMNDTRVWAERNDRIERRRAKRSGLLVAGMKDVVVGASRFSAPNTVGIFGGIDAQGDRVQPAAAPHVITYSDYSQGGRLVRNTMDVDGVGQRTMAQVFADPRLAPLVTDAAPGPVPRYRTDARSRASDRGRL
jgi:hypothetical protein